MLKVKEYFTIHSMLKFFILDTSFKAGVVAVSTGLAPDSAFAPSFFGRPSGQLPSSHYKRPCGSRQAKIVHYALWACASPMAWRRRWLLESQPPS